MQKLSIADFDVLATAKRNRNSVAKKLSEFLTETVATLKVGDAVKIGIQDFLKDDKITDVHYYSVLKTLRTIKNIDYRVLMTTANRCNAIALKKTA